MECLGAEIEEGFCESVNDVGNDNGVGGMYGDSMIAEKGRESSSSSDFLTSETTGNEEQSRCSCSEESSSPAATLGWPIDKSEPRDCSTCNQAGDKICLEKQGSEISGKTHSQQLLIFFFF